MRQRTLRAPAHDLPVLGEFDVVVCGGGPAGCAAALSAWRAGLAVLLVENQGQLGGMGTSGLVSHWLGGRTAHGRWIVGGLFRELATEAAGLAATQVVAREMAFAEVDAASLQAARVVWLAEAG